MDWKLVSATSTQAFGGLRGQQTSGPQKLFQREPPNQIRRSQQPLDSYLCTVFLSDICADSDLFHNEIHLFGFCLASLLQKHAGSEGDLRHCIFLQCSAFCLLYMLPGRVYTNPSDLFSNSHILMGLQLRTTLCLPVCFIKALFRLSECRRRTQNSETSAFCILF